MGRSLSYSPGRGNPLYRFGALCGKRAWKVGLCHYLASGGLPGIHPVSSHFTHSPYATGTLPTVAMVLNSTVGGFAYILRLCEPFKWSLLKVQQFLPPPQISLVFMSRNYGDLYPGAGTLGYVVCPGAGIAHSQGVPPNFFPPHVNVKSPVAIPPPPLHTTLHPLTSLPFLCVFAPPTHLTEYVWLL